MCAFKMATAIATNLENKSNVKESFMSSIVYRDDAEMPFVDDDFDEFERTADAKLLGRLALDISDIRLEIDAVHSFEKNHCFILLVGGTLDMEPDVAALSSGLQKGITDRLDKQWSPIYSNSVEVLSAYRPAEELIAVPCTYYSASTKDVYSDKESIVAAEGGTKLCEAALYAAEQYFGSYFDMDSFVL